MRALASDWNGEVAPRFMRNLAEIAHQDGGLFGQKLGEYRNSHALGGDGGVLEQQLFGIARALDVQGRFNEATLGSAINACLRERLNAEVRGLLGHVAREGGFGINSCLNELKRGAQTCPLGEMVQRILGDGGRAKVGRRLHSPVSVEENLLRR